MQKKNLSPAIKSFITAIAVLFTLMCICYALTIVLPSGSYQYINDDSGNSVIDTSIPFQFCEGGISIVQWLFSPLLVLTVDGSAMLIAIIIFLIVIGGIFSSLQKCGLMEYMLQTITKKYGNHRYRFLAILILFFMAMGALIGSFEEIIPLVPIVCALCINLGWDKLTGITCSILAVGCGFSCGICNPFTIGIAQTIAGLPMFSGAWLRIVTFIIIYLLLLSFVWWHCRRIEKPVNYKESEFVYNPSLAKALKVFGIIMAISLAIVLSSSFVSALQDYTLIIVALAFLISGISCCMIAKMKAKEFFQSFLQGSLEVLPAVIMILMASSIKYTLTEAKVLDTIVYYIISALKNLPRGVIILLIYLIVLLMEIFISSGSAKAFMLMPLILPIAQMFNISSQLCVLAYAFGDGFSNIIYPTNPGLLISLGLANTSYIDWFKHVGKLLVLILIITSAILLFGLAVGY